MSVILLVLLGAVFLLIAVLCLPVAFAGRIHLAEKVSGEGELAWAGGLAAARLGIREGKPDFSWRLGPFNGRPRRRSGRDKGEKPRKSRHSGKGKQRKRDGFRPVSGWKSIAPFVDRRLIGKTVSFLRRLFRSLHLKLRLEGEYGTGDPALTGYLTAALAALNSESRDLSLRPNFKEAFLDLRGEFRCRVVPAGLLLHTGGFLLAAPVRRLWWSGIIKPKLTRRLFINAQRKH
ncbi:MAG: DUF2953 domain-containing protein [Bacillota bacterium]